MMDATLATPAVDFDNSYARDLSGLYVEWEPSKVPAPKLVVFNRELSGQLSPALAHQSDRELAELLSGNRIPAGASPLAQAYAGHQFGGLSPQLGDGRAVLLGEVIGKDGGRYDIQLKGSGRTPFSRGGDGKAALGPMLREYLISEAMHALDVPTTRSLAVVTTGEEVMRERALPGAILTRVASSHIRVGTFQFFAIRQDESKLRRLADYSIRRHHPCLASAPEPYLPFFEAVVEAQASLVAKWMLFGFVHGVMNTDNMAISGETIDYGPCAFIDRYEPDAVFSSIDKAGRYAFSRQPHIAQWNLTRFAETLVPLIDQDPEEASRKLTNVVNSFPHRYIRHWLYGMRSKLGLLTEQEGDLDLINSLYSAMAGQNVDYTLLYRRLATALRGDAKPLLALFKEPETIHGWLDRYERRQSEETIDHKHRADAMDRINPIYIPRNHNVEEALSIAVDTGEIEPFNKLLDAVTHPFSERPGYEKFAEPAPLDAEPCVTFCGT